jgi:hypothetical protein
MLFSLVRHRSGIRNGLSVLLRITGPAFKAGDWTRPGARRERLQHAIDADIEWLRAPTSRKSIVATSRKAE